MNSATNALRLKFIETYLREGASSDNYNVVKQELYRTGFNRSQIVTMLVEGELYGNLDNFYRKHPAR